jgi:hypothetical protein
MDFLSDLIKIALPAGAVLYGMYLVMNNYQKKEFDKKMAEVKVKNTEFVMPVRLQAYERMCLFLERIAPNNLIIRINTMVFSAGEFHQLLLSEIREEYNHNLSQQLYMSDEAWTAIRTAMEEIVIHINNAAAIVPKDAKSLDLAKGILEQMMQYESDPTLRALQIVKNEIRQLF